MESGLDLYDKRNSVKLNRAGRKNRKKREAMPIGGSEDLKLMDQKSKVAMTGSCRFCLNAFKESRAICPYCITCQYCGLVPSSAHTCEFCGNHDLDYKRQPRKRRIIRGAESPPEPRKNKTRIVRRLGPQRRHRPEHLRPRSA